MNRVSAVSGPNSVMFVFALKYCRYCFPCATANKIIVKITKNGNLIYRSSMMFSDFPPSNIVKLEEVGPTLSYFRLLLSYSSVATTVVTEFHDLYGAF